MAEQATIFQVVQIGVESTPGTPVPGNRRLQSISITPGVNAEVEPIRSLGGKFATGAAPGREWVEADIEGIPTYDELAYLLSSLLVSTTPVQVNPPNGTAYRWVFTPAQNTPDAIRTFTVEQGSPVRAWRFAYGLVTELSLSFSRESLELSGSMLGQRLQDGITLTSNPTVVRQVPILPSQVDVYLDASHTDLGTTKLTRVLEAELTIGDRFGPVWVLDSAVPSFVTHVETEPDATLSLLLEADAQGMSLLPVIRTGEKRFIRIQATGENIEGTTPYLFQVDLCGVVTGVDQFSDKDGVYAIKWTLTTAFEAAWGKAIEVTLVNTLSAL